MKLNLLIVGGGSSLGLGLAKKMVREHHNVYIVSSRKNEIFQKNENVKVFTAKLDNAQDVRKITKKVLSNCNGFDVVFYNIGGGLGMSESMLSFHELNKILWFNFGIIQEFNRILIPRIRPSGKIICVGSIATRQIVGSLGYTIAKTALETYVKFMGKELAGQQKSILAISIGAYWEVGNAMDRLRIKKPNIYKDFIRNRLPRKKMASTDEIVPFLSNFCVNDTSVFSGAVIPMDGAESNSL